jgi:hypothetical protein
VGSIRECVANLDKRLPAMYVFEGDSQQAVRHLEDAREIYKACPELVVVPSAKLDRLLAELAE